MLGCKAFSQTSINGVVNTYHKVIAINTSQSGLKLDNVAGLAVYDRVMVIQMKGATINTTVNSSSFGSVTSLNEAGNYEIATICDVRNDSVFLLQQLLRSYSVTNKVQLVKIARYASAIVTDSLKAASWDSTTGKGGVLAVIVTGTLTLNAPVSATGKGFKGGIYYKDDGGCLSNAFQNYAYDPTPTSYFIYSNVQEGSYKGESVVNLPLSLRGGKGACANGGGGGNNHNNGGGGGSNGASGGRGGDNLTTAPGACTGQQAAVGGYSLNNNSGTKIFFGGGGGAGHANNTLTSAGGGNGGGIVFIQAETLVSNGFTISANGLAGGNVFGDGASGGGGGGNILLEINNYSDAVSLEAKGGNGGTVDDEFAPGRCYGEGGGGSGGIIYFSGLQPVGTASAAGGTRGAKVNSTCSSITGTNGGAGSIVANYQYMESSIVSPTCSNVLPIDWLYFKVDLQRTTALLQWDVTGSSDQTQFFVQRKELNRTWLSIAKITGSTIHSGYNFRDQNLLAGTYQYRIRAIDNQKIFLSSTQEVVLQEKEQSVVFFNQATRTISIRQHFVPDDAVQIFDVFGKCVFEKTFTSTADAWQQNISFLSNGIYVVKTGKASLKFVMTNQ